MINFQDFINEAKLRGNSAADDKFIDDIDSKAQRELGVRKDNFQDQQRFGGELQGLVIQSKSLMFRGLNRQQVRERTNQLQDLAIEVITAEYQDILNNVDLEIKLVPNVTDDIPEITGQDVRPNERNQRQEAEEIQPEQDSEEPKNTESTDKKKSFLDNLLGSSPKKKEKKKEDFLKTLEYKQKIDKAKLINNIIQGEAKNTKNILHSEEVKSGLRRIFGGNADEIFRLWDQITKVADKLDWAWDIEDKSSRMSSAPQFMAGAVKVSWPEAEEAQSQGEDEESQSQNEMPSPEDAEDILKKIEEGGDLGDQSEEISNLLSSGNPKIFAVGVDFPMLIHEAVKGIYELIAAAYLPSQDSSKSEISKAKIVKMGVSSFEDEAEDFRYGPYIAAALRDFINSCSGVDRYPNIREFVFGKMVLLPEGEFLSLMKGIFEKTEKAKKKISELISEVIDEIKEWEISEIDEPRKEFDTEEEEDGYPREGEKEEESDIDKLIKQSQNTNKSEEEEEIDIKKMSKEQLSKFASSLSPKKLQDLIDNALDEGDYETLGKLQPFMKESLQWKLYESEIKKILK